MPRRKAGSNQGGTSRRKGVASFRFRVVVMAKEPTLGRVKTRLARGVGATAATRFYRSTANAVLGRIGADSRFETLVGITPDTGASSRAPAFPSSFARLRQGRGDLGLRMLRLAQVAPPGPVVIIGTDIPGVTAAALFEALQLLGRNDMVFGPAHDGGFWLVGFSRRRPIRSTIFDNVRWSHPETLGDVLARCRDLRIGFATTLSDVDSVAEMKRQDRLVGRRILPS